jgi:hypothetical protein
VAMPRPPKPTRSAAAECAIAAITRSTASKVLPLKQ